jgi:hypothetical protein
MGDRRKATTPVVTREQILDRLSRCWISLPGFNADIVEAQANEIMALLSGATVVVDREKLLKFFAQYHVPKAAEEITDNFIASGLLSTKGEG